MPDPGEGLTPDMVKLLLRDWPIRGRVNLWQRQSLWGLKRRGLAINAVVRYPDGRMVLAWLLTLPGERERERLRGRVG